MQRISIIVVFISFIAAVGSAQRSIPASVDFESYRPVGEIRGWTFVAKDSTIGQLISTVKRETEIDGINGVEIRQVLRLDYNRIGTERKLEIKSSHFVSTAGHYLGDQLEITVNEQVEKLELERDGGKIKGYFTRAGNKIEQEIKFAEKGFAADILFLDLYENFLARRDIKVGDTITDSVFVPQTMLVEKVEAVVEHFGLISLYNQVKDSVFVIRFVQPQVMIFYFSPNKRLVKAEFLAQQMKAYLDIVRQLPAEKMAEPSFGLERFAKLLPHYGVFLLMGAVGLLFLAGGDIYRHNLYVFVIAGGASFVIATFTQVPFQSFLAEKIFLPKISAGGSPLLWAAVPALPAGFIQELIKFVVIFNIFKFLRLNLRNPLFIGGAIGAGFGIVEASYILSHLPEMPLWSVNLVERGFIILYHTVSGVMLSAAILLKSKMKKAVLIMVVVLVNSMFRFMPIFVQRDMLDAELYYILIPMIPMVLLLYCVTLIKTFRNAFRN